MQSRQQYEGSPRYGRGERSPDWPGHDAPGDPSWMGPGYTGGPWLWSAQAGPYLYPPWERHGGPGYRMPRGPQGYGSQGWNDGHHASSSWGPSSYDGGEDERFADQDYGSGPQGGYGQRARMQGGGYGSSQGRFSQGPPRGGWQGSPGGYGVQGGGQRFGSSEPHGGYGPTGGGYSGWQDANDRDNRWGGYSDRMSTRGVPATSTPRGPKGYSRSDDRIKEEISDAILVSDVDASDVTIRVSDGEVTLQGTIDSREGKRHLEDLAESVLGVKQVHNSLRVESRSKNGSSLGSDSESEDSRRDTFGSSRAGTTTSSSSSSTRGA